MYACFHATVKPHREREVVRLRVCCMLHARAPLRTCASWSGSLTHLPQGDGGADGSTGTEESGKALAAAVSGRG